MKLDWKLKKLYLDVKLFYEFVKQCELYPFRFKRTQKDHIESSLQSNKKSGLILSSILTPIFYSIVEALNAVFLGAIESEGVYTEII